MGVGWGGGVDCDCMAQCTHVGRGGESAVREVDGCGENGMARVNTWVGGEGGEGQGADQGSCYARAMGVHGSAELCPCKIVYNHKHCATHYAQSDWQYA